MLDYRCQGGMESRHGLGQPMSKRRQHPDLPPHPFIAISPSVGTNKNKGCRSRSNALGSSVRFR